MLPLLQPITFRALSRNVSLSLTRRGAHQQAYRSLRSSLKPLLIGCACTVSAILAFQTSVHLDAVVPEKDETGTFLCLLIIVHSFYSKCS